MCYTSLCFGRREKDEHCRHFEEKVQRIADAAPQPEMWFWKVSFPLNGTMIFSILILYATSIGAVKSDQWKETTLIEKVNEKSKTIQGWKCNHCETDFWNTNLARLQFHLSGDNSLRDFTHGYSGVEVCTKVGPPRHNGPCKR